MRSSVSDMASWIRRRLSRLVCFTFGHLYAHPSAMWKMVKLHQYSDLDAVCLRCYRQLHLTKALTDSVFAPSPVLEALRKRSSSES